MRDGAGGEWGLKLHLVYWLGVVRADMIPEFEKSPFSFNKNILKWIN